MRLTDEQCNERRKTLFQKGYGAIPETDYLDTIDALKAEQAAPVAGAYLAAAEKSKCTCISALCSQPKCGEMHTHLSENCVHHNILALTPADAKAALEQAQNTFFADWQARTRLLLADRDQRDATIARLQAELAASRKSYRAMSESEFELRRRLVSIDAAKGGQQP